MECLFHRIPDRDVRTPKTVDALLRITDEEELRPITIAGDREGQVALSEVGVLKLIDDQETAPPADLGQCGHPVAPAE